MSKIETGGPAFPVLELDQVSGHVCAQHMGASLRDYFAAKAMQSLLIDESNIHGAAKFSYQVADAMLAERSKS